MPVESADDADWEPGGGHLFTARRIEQMKNTEAVFVGDKSDQLAIPGEVEFVDVPFDVIGKISVLLCRQVNVSQPLKALNSSTAVIKP